MHKSLHVLVLAAAGLGPLHAAAPVVEFDHLLIVVQAGAPERSVLERAGFIVWPDVQRQVGQGTASVMVELHGSFLELIWRDSSVLVNSDKMAVARKYALRSQWRSSGWSPFAIALRRMARAPDSLPFSTWPIPNAWHQSGEVIRMITARSDSTSPSVWVVGRSTAIDNAAAPPRARAHPNGARRITAIELTIPRGTPETEAITVLRNNGVATLTFGESWLLTVTLDSMRQAHVQDLRPTLPLIVRF